MHVAAAKRCHSPQEIRPNLVSHHSKLKSALLREQLFNPRAIAVACLSVEDQKGEDPLKPSQQ